MITSSSGVRSVRYPWSLRKSLTLFRIGLFGAAHGWERGGSLHKIRFDYIP